MSTTPFDGRRITPRRLGAAAVVYGVFVTGWYLGQPVTPDCHADQAAVDRAAKQYEPDPPSEPMRRPEPIPTPAPSAFPDAYTFDRSYSTTLTVTSYAVTCTNDTSERPRLRAWFGGDWR
ncbi:hypothetical protein [Streptomyces lienomycini]|uniref:Secreted protein n=1 Tax=Streptomyces lienomycini TaxID=284035 RepID=A0ABV9WXK0_9ACTN|nr:hypothetical protein [Streptomyces lienomycini]